MFLIRDVNTNEYYTSFGMASFNDKEHATAFKTRAQAFNKLATISGRTLEIAKAS